MPARPGAHRAVSYGDRADNGGRRLMRGTSAISRFLIVAVVFGLAMLQTQPTVRAAEPTAPSSGSGPNPPAASSVPADPPLPANARLAALPPKPPAKLSSHLNDLVRATAA